MLKAHALIINKLLMRTPTMFFFKLMTEHIDLYGAYNFNVKYLKECFLGIVCTKTVGRTAPIRESGGCGQV